MLLSPLRIDATAKPLIVLRLRKFDILRLQLSKAVDQAGSRVIKTALHAQYDLLSAVNFAKHSIRRSQTHLTSIYFIHGKLDPHFGYIHRFYYFFQPLLIDIYLVLRQTVQFSVKIDFLPLTL